MSPLHDAFDRFESAASHLDPIVRRELRDEIAAHLDAAIAARMELGDPREEAERAALADFGSFIKVVRAMPESVPSSWFDGRFVARVGGGWLGLFGLGYAGWHFAPGAQMAVILGLGVGGLALVGVTLLEGARARRPQFLPILALYAVFTLFGAVGQAAMALPDSPGGMAIQRATAEEFVPSLTAQADQVEAAILRYDAERKGFANGSLVAPTGFQGSPERITFVTLADRAAAARRWAEADTRWRASAESFARTFRSESERYAARLREPWYLGTLGWLGVSGGISIVPAGITLVLNLVGCFFGWTARRIRNRRQKLA